ncbi:hypothetical protein [Reyranella sp.]|uniref:hypothetical protein n=1 Tax=Reyranella sp. TaxID=1929291 RepID=UPI00262CC373|nr:hypothetical protein [Reyranella sp.]
MEPAPAAGYFLASSIADGVGTATDCSSGTVFSSRRASSFSNSATGVTPSAFRVPGT